MIARSSAGRSPVFIHDFARAMLAPCTVCTTCTSSFVVVAAAAATVKPPHFFPPFRYISPTTMFRDVHRRASVIVLSRERERERERERTGKRAVKLKGTIRIKRGTLLRAV